MAGGLKEIKGIAYHDADEVRINDRRKLIEPMDKIPFPARNLLPIQTFGPTGHGVEYKRGTIILTYICPLVGRLDDSGYDAMRSIKEMADAFKANSESTLIMVSSVRHPQHVVKAYECGVDAITIPPNVLSLMFRHSLTDAGIHIFRGDIEEMKLISSKTINSNLVVNKDDTLQHCLSLMVMHKGGAVAIRSDDNRPIGIFTAGDLKRLVQKNAPFNLDDRIERFMTKKPISIDISETVSKAGEIMHQFNIDQLVVVDNESVVGILDAKEVTF